LSSRYLTRLTTIPTVTATRRGPPTETIIENRRRAEFITPIPKSKKQKSKTAELFDDTEGLSNGNQKYDPISIINEIRSHVDSWRQLPENTWQVTPYRLPPYPW